MNEYEAHIAKCKAVKNQNKVNRILKYILLGIQKGYDTALLVQKLNDHHIKPLVSDKWTANSLQMQIMLIARLDPQSSLAMGFGFMLKTGLATNADYELFQTRISK